MDDILIDEGLVLKDRLREARDASRSLTNQEIADRSGLTIATVNNYFSNRSKASTALTVGRLCKVLHVSMDDVFGIVPEDGVATRTAHELRIAELEAEAAHREEIIALKDDELKRRRNTIIGLFAISILLLLLLLCYIIFDFLNPAFGLFRG